MPWSQRFYFLSGEAANLRILSGEAATVRRIIRKRTSGARVHSERSHSKYFEQKDYGLSRLRPIYTTVYSFCLRSLHVIFVARFLRHATIQLLFRFPQAKTTCRRILDHVCYDIRVVVYNCRKAIVGMI